MIMIFTFGELAWMSFICLVFGALCGAMVASKNWEASYEDLRIEAVKRGFAERLVTPEGEVSWRWIDPQPCESPL
jgi:hypothetical protein